MSRGWVRLLLVAAAVLALDQVTKAIVRSSIPPGDSRRVIPGVLDLTNVRNTGVAFGALEGAGSPWRSSACRWALIVVYFVSAATSRGCGCRWACWSGGALGNLADRAREGAVVDFIDPASWPAFNVADSCIVVGVFGAPRG